jgi:hypothetical protein
VGIPCRAVCGRERPSGGGFWPCGPVVCRVHRGTGPWAKEGRKEGRRREEGGRQAGRGDDDNDMAPEDLAGHPRARFTTSAAAALSERERVGGNSRGPVARSVRVPFLRWHLPCPARPASAFDTYKPSVHTLPHRHRRRRCRFPGFLRALPSPRFPALTNGAFARSRLHRSSMPVYQGRRLRRRLVVWLPGIVQVTAACGTAQQHDELRVKSSGRAVHAMPAIDRAGGRARACVKRMTQQPRSAAGEHTHGRTVGTAPGSCGGGGRDADVELEPRRRRLAVCAFQDRDGTSTWRT